MTPGAEGSALTILYNADERVFGPYWSVEAWFMMFLPLVMWDADGRIVPRLAQSWEHSADMRHWTFWLRSDVRWHDGVPVTAHDVKFSIELAAHPDILFDNAWHDVDSITVEDDTTFTISYARPKDARNTWIVYWPKHLLEDLEPSDFFQWEYWTRPVGNGPYRYVRHVPKTMMELRANPDFYSGKPAIDRLILKFSVGGGSPIVELLSGNVDVLTWLNQPDIPKLAADARFRVHHHVDPGIPWLHAILWNQRHPALGDPRVRRALTMAIDRPTLLAALDLPPDLVITDAPFASPHRRELIPEPLPYDPAGARALLSEAGWGEPESRRTPGRDSLRFGALVAASTTSEQAAVLIQAELRRIGVAMQIRTLDGSLVRRRVQSGDFDAAFQPVWNAPDGYLRWFGPEGPLGYRNEEAVALLESIKETMDSTRLDGIYQALSSMIQTDMPITFLHPQVRSVVVPRWLQGLETPYRADPIQFSERLWIEGRD